MRSRQHLCFLIVVVLVSTFAGGCGDGRPKRVKVSGQVLIDGKPLEYGFVQVMPAGERAATGKIGPNGRFTLTTFDPDDGCVLGKHNVAVIATESINGSSQRWHAPKKYVDATKSDLQVEITEPTDSLVIELTWDGGKPFIEKFDAE